MGAKTTCAIMAPTFPAAAEMPWQVVRKRVGKTSAGVMNVVALGPGIISVGGLGVEGE
jgi:hypothetical protein